MFLWYKELSDGHFELKLDNTPLKPCTQYKYVGVILDETLNMEANYNYIFKRLSYKIFQFCKIRNTKSQRYLKYSTLLTFTFKDRVGRSCC